MNDLIEKVIQWGNDRNLIEGNTVERQFSKTFEEVLELKAAIEDDEEIEMIDAIGDITVTLILLSAIKGWSFEDCLQSAYDEIKNRKGKTVDGVFIKDTQAVIVDDMDEPLPERTCTDEEGCTSCQ